MHYKFSSLFALHFLSVSLASARLLIDYPRAPRAPSVFQSLSEMSAVRDVRCQRCPLRVNDDPRARGCSQAFWCLPVSSTSQHPHPAPSNYHCPVPSWALSTLTVNSPFQGLSQSLCQQWPVSPFLYTFNSTQSLPKFSVVFRLVKSQDDSLFKQYPSLVRSIIINQVLM